MTVDTPTWRITNDTWAINTMREAKAYRDSLGEPDEFWDAYLAECEAAIAEIGTTTERPIADEEPAARRPGSGHTNYGAQRSDAPSDAQQRFIRSLCSERGIDADEVLRGLTKSKASREIDRLKKLPRQSTARPATERQMEFLQDLLATRAHGYEAKATWTFDEASAAITVLLAAPKVKTSAHGIRHGRYAFAPADGSPASFYRIAQDGRIYVIAGPAEHPYRGKLNDTLEAIKADTKAAAALYGQLIGSCGRCGLTLTDETSRSIGLGPICAGKSDW